MERDEKMRLGHVEKELRDFQNSLQPWWIPPESEARKRTQKRGTTCFLSSQKLTSRFLRFPNQNLTIRLPATRKPKETNTSHKPERVRFAEPKPETPPPLKLEVEEPAKISHPLIVLPVYALGGFFILKWVWARWKERAKKASDDDKQSPDAHQSPAEDGEGFC
ncbi:hypothetical protein K2173_020556 [Erythroxylum novogranatense]|uniref:Uncharacterized protein n=1 Tax=Erythroxylum novogranatense TaxID=1862640 RepID=A0AAV8TIH7_9ROSI|nr:hypothetical protein K2173_020556 [Erythroxylum novogranatense]